MNKLLNSLFLKQMSSSKKSEIKTKVYSLEFYLCTLESLGIFSSWKKAQNYSTEHCLKFCKEVAKDNDEKVDYKDTEEFYRDYYRIVEVTHLNLSNPIYLHRTGNYGNYWCAYDWDPIKEKKTSRYLP